MTDLLKQSNFNDDRLIESITNLELKLDICEKYKKAKPETIIALPLTMAFNETIAMDLKT